MTERAPRTPSARHGASVATSPSPQAQTPEAAEATLMRQLDAAHAHCVERGAQLTAQRREVLELLLRRQGSAKAYDIQEDMQARHGRVAPTTVYRALEFLLEQHLLHKVDSTNSFVVCSSAEHEHHSLMLICTQCGRVQERHDDALLHALELALGQSVNFQAQAVEVKGLCAQCSVAAPGLPVPER